MKAKRLLSLLFLGLPLLPAAGCGGDGDDDPVNQPPAACLIEGAVEAADGRPVAGAQVFLEGVSMTFNQTAVTDAQGAFTIEARDGQTFRLRATTTNQACGWIQIAVTSCPQNVAQPLRLTDPTVLRGALTGVVRDVWDGYLGGAAVAAAGRTVTTNEEGYFSLTNLAAGQVVVAVSRENYIGSYEIATILDGQTTHLPDVTLQQSQFGSVDGAAGGGVQVQNGIAAVEFPAGAFVSEDGQPYPDAVNVRLAAMQPPGADFYAVFPGEFEGVRTDGSTVMFISFGFMDVSLLNADRSAPVRLAGGVTAALRLQVAAGLEDLAPPTIPMWYFDPATGRWIEEGSADLVAGAYVAEVAHFTTWSWDLPLADVCTIEGEVHDAGGEPVPDARVISQGLQIAVTDEDYTDASGRFSLRGILNESFAIRAIKGSLASESVQVTVAQCPCAVDAPLELREPAFSIKLTWGERPYDLDSWLYLPDRPAYSDVYISYRNPGTLTAAPYTQLDTDDPSSYGPEIISSFQFYPGGYSYWVHNFSGDHPLAQSGARVRFETAGQVREYDVTNVPGTDTAGAWHVFDLTWDATGGVAITDVMVWQRTDDMISKGAKRR